MTSFQLLYSLLGSLDEEYKLYDDETGYSMTLQEGSAAFEGKDTVPVRSKTETRMLVFWMGYWAMLSYLPFFSILT